MYFHVLLDSNNRISIPYQIRKQINLKKGDSLVMTIVDNEIHLNSIDKKISEAQKLVKQYCGDSDLLEDLLLMRDEELRLQTNDIETGQQNK